jgi:hypothetical protein
MSAEQHAHYLEMRAVTIRYLKMLEDELIAAGGLRPSDRACLTREERRAREFAPESSIDIATITP